jgi:hypothetical protein
MEKWHQCYAIRGASAIQLLKATGILTTFGLSGLSAVSGLARRLSPNEGVAATWFGSLPQFVNEMFLNLAADEILYASSSNSTFFGAACLALHFSTRKLVVEAAVPNKSQFVCPSDFPSVMRITTLNWLAQKQHFFLTPKMLVPENCGSIYGKLFCDPKKNSSAARFRIDYTSLQNSTAEQEALEFDPETPVADSHSYYYVLGPSSCRQNLNSKPFFDLLSKCSRPNLRSSNPNASSSDGVVLHEQNSKIPDEKVLVRKDISKVVQPMPK